MLKMSIAALALMFVAPAWPQPATQSPADRANRPGGTTQISPTPGPATSPALASPQLPPAAVENREKAQAAKTARKAQKKTARATKKSSSGARAAQSGSKDTMNTPSTSSKPSAQ